MPPSRAMSSGFRSSVQKPTLVDVASVSSGASASRSFATEPSRIQTAMPFLSLSFASSSSELSWHVVMPAHAYAERSRPRTSGA